MQREKPPSGVVIMHVTSDLTGLKSYRASICGINTADTSSAGELKQEGTVLLTCRNQGFVTEIVFFRRWITVV
jgi:hypothetical protein